MIGVIARHEFGSLVRDGRFRWSATVMLALLMVSLSAGYAAQRTARLERDSAQTEMQDWWYAQQPKNPHSAAHYGLWAFKPVSSLAFVERGIDPYTGTATWLEAHRQNDFAFRPARDATALQRFGEWTASTILQQLVPLLIIVLGFGAFAAEREQGTLRQLSGLGVPTRALILGKSFGIAAAIAMVLVPAALAGAVALMLSVGVGPQDSSRLGWLAGVHLVWYTIVLGATLLVSYVATTSRRSLVVLLGLWTLQCTLAPRLVASLSRSAYPTPARADFQSEIAADLANGLDGHSPAGARAERLEKELLKQHNVSSRRELPENFEALAMQASEVHADSVFDRHYGALHAQIDKQLAAQQTASLLFPLIAVRSLSTAIAGTDVNAHRAFADSAEQYRRLIQVQMNGWLARNTKEGATFSARADSTLWAEVPPFTFTPTPAHSAMAALPWSLVALTSWMLVLGGVLVSRRTVRVD